jgi:hypothetical protein
VLDDWQAWAAEMLLAERADGSRAASQALIIVPRQNGKNSILEAVELYGLFVELLECQVHSAHLADTSAKHMARLKMLISADPELDAITKIYETNGKERIVNRETGGVIEFSTRTKSSKRGASPQRIVFDEALFLSDEQLQAMVPGLAAQSMDPDTAPQMVFTSSAPLAESTVLHRLRKAGVECTSRRMFFAEWGCDPGVDPYDQEAWYRANPGLGIRISPEFIAESEIPILQPDAFLIERLGVVLGEDAAPTVMPEWPKCADPGSQMIGTPSIAVDVAPDLSWSSVAVAGVREDGLQHLELIEHLPGTGLTVDVVVKVVQLHGGQVWLDPRSEAAGLIEPLKRAGVDVVEVKTLDYLKACVQLRQDVANDLVRHRDQTPLSAAVAGAAIKPVGEGWVWARRSSSVDISPLVAVTLAKLAADQADIRTASVGGSYDQEVYAAEVERIRKEEADAFAAITRK